MGIWYDSYTNTPKQNEHSSFPFLEECIYTSFSYMGKITTKGYYSHIYPLNKQKILIAVDGKIDNLNVLANELNLDVLNVSEVISTLYLRHGFEGLYRLMGAASIILFDMERNVTVLYRLFLKGLPLYFSKKNNRITVSSNPIYLTYREDISSTLNEVEIAKLFAAKPSEWGDSVFSEIDALAHGEVIIFSKDKMERKKRPLDILLQNEHDYRSDKDIFKEYSSLLKKAVDETIVEDKKYGIMLSSGMDSSSLAFFATNTLKSMKKNLTAYSWSLPGDTADESKHIKLLCQKLDIDLKMFNGETFGPFDHLDKLFLIPDTPYTNMFWALNEECYKKASDDGVQILYNGAYGDSLFRPDFEIQYIEAWNDKRFDILIERIISKGFNKLLKYFLKKKKPFETRSMNWLTQKSLDLLQHGKNKLHKKRFKNFDAVLSPFLSAYLGREQYLTKKFSLERVEPHRNLELIIFSLKVPSYTTYRYGQTKYFAREAMKGLLPEEIRTQPRVGIITTLVEKSFHRNIEKVREKIWENPFSWNSYVKESWMQEKLHVDAKVNNYDLYVIWLCITLSAWLKAIKPGGELYEYQIN